MTITGIRTRNGRRHHFGLTACFTVLTTIAVLAATQSAADAATVPPLGSASTFAVLAGTAVTNSGLSVVNGDLGVSPGTVVTGFPPGTVSGSQHAGDTAAATAQTDLATAYSNAVAQAPTTSGLSAIGGGPALTPGVYNAAFSLGVSGTVTLDGQGDPNAVFIFQIGSTLTTDSGSAISLTNGARPCNVFWQVGSSATLGSGSGFAGSILASASITVTGGSTIVGRVLARNGAVTLDDDSVSAPSCTTEGSPLVSLPGAAAAAGISGLAGLRWFLVRRRKTGALA